jgi:hypothetical protein
VVGTVTDPGKDERPTLIIDDIVNCICYTVESCPEPNMDFIASMVKLALIMICNGSIKVPKNMEAVAKLEIVLDPLGIAALGTRAPGASAEDEDEPMNHDSKDGAGGSKDSKDGTVDAADASGAKAAAVNGLITISSYGVVRKYIVKCLQLNNNMEPEPQADNDDVTAIEASLVSTQVPL